MIPAWKGVIAAIVVCFIILAGLGIYGAWDGSQEQWHDTGKVSWISESYFVTASPRDHWAENFTITTLTHGSFTFTTDISCNNAAYYHCQYPYTPNSPHLGDIVGLVQHKDKTFDMIFK